MASHRASTLSRATFAAIALTASLSACGGGGSSGAAVPPVPTPVSVPSALPSATPTPVTSQTPTPGPTATAKPTPTPTPKPTATPSPTPSPSPTATPLSALRYVALGDSTTAGYESSAQCNFNSSCTGGMGYAPQFARMLVMGSASGPDNPSLATPNFTDLGIPGAVLDQTDQTYGDQSWGPYGSGGVPDNMVTGELPAITTAPDLITVYIGKNDVNVLFSAVRHGDYPDAQHAIDDFGSRFQTQVAAVAAKLRPGGKLILFNLLNVGQQPGTVITNPSSLSTADKDLLTTLSVGITKQYINPLYGHGGVSGIVDMLCYGLNYQVPTGMSTSFYNPDGVHPTDYGYGLLAQKLWSALTAPSAPSGSCPQYEAAP